MAHKEQMEYCNQIKKLYPEYFDGVYILDAGSLDINGNNQYLFTNSHYIGVDIGEGKNVDIISKIHELQLPDHTFDTIISTEVFEHDQYYTESIKNIYRMLKPGGIFLFTCATTGRPEHGTSRTKPQDAPLIQNHKEWQDYYKNLTEDDIKEIFNLNDYFSKFQFITNQDSCDLYFYGIKSGTWQKRTNRSFHIYNNKNFNSKIIFFGASSALAKKFNLLKEMNIIPDYICDNDINKHGKEVESYIIHNPEILFNQDEEFIVIITSSFIDEIKSQLAKYPNIKEVYSYNEISYKLKTE